MNKPRAMAIAAHPDDIEFMMGGTLLLLKEAGYETHYLNIANGSCGSQVYSAARLRTIRRHEAQAAARILDAVWHPSFTEDMEIYYEDRLLRKVAAVVREVDPTILLTLSPQDYMEDHMNACRVAVTAAFARNLPNYRTTPRRPATNRNVTLYHAMPVGLCDPLRRRVSPGAYVNITSVFKTKMSALAEHQSQQDWLRETQKLNHYLIAMQDQARELGRMSRKFKYAEGWRRHLHFGYCAETDDPLRDALGKNYLINRKYETELERGIAYPSHDSP
ncbi:MAG: PIG-L family deacetylase [Candidatus Sumerlaeota bacterium]|nr:PIG-L family deacetylase [Candidatus Sumerlaeota bacterium]